MISEALGLRPLMGERKQKFLSVAIVTVGAFLGFEALSYSVKIYQINTFLHLSIWIYLFHIFWLTFIFDLHLKKRGVISQLSLNHHGMKLVWEAFKERFAHTVHWNYLRHYQNYLILPAVIYWSVVILIYLNPFRIPIKQILILAATVCMGIVYWHFKEMFSRRFESEHVGLKILSVIKIIAAYGIFTALLGVAKYHACIPDSQPCLSLDWFWLSVFALTFILLYQALFQHKYLTFQIHFILPLIAVAVTASAWWIYEYWNVNYWTGGLVIVAVYNHLWGLMHHHLDRNLSWRIVIEYSIMLILVLSLLIASHDFGPTII